jgi:hypothetical protein
MQIRQQNYPYTDVKGMLIPEHDKQVVDEADPANVTITYSLDGTTVATKSILVSGSTTTITLTVV